MSRVFFTSHQSGQGADLGAVPNIMSYDEEFKRAVAFAVLTLPLPNLCLQCCQRW